MAGERFTARGEEDGREAEGEGVWEEEGGRCGGCVWAVGAGVAGERYVVVIQPFSVEVFFLPFQPVPLVPSSRICFRRL